MKRKIILFGALILCLLAAVSCNGFKETEYAVVSEGMVSASGFIYDKYENSTVRITGIQEMPAQLVIPAEIDGMAVVEIADNAFAEDGTLLYLEFSSDVKLGRAFCADCPSLVAVNLANKITSIPREAFIGCSNLSLVAGTGSLTAIDMEAFAGCLSLPMFDIPAVTKIGEEAFRGCNSITSVTLSENVTELGTSAFWSCESLTSVTIDCPAEIPRYAFLDCIALTDLKLGGKAASIAEEAFRGCLSLYSVEFGKEVKSIGEYAFYACGEIQKVTFLGDISKTAIAEGNESLTALGGAK